MNTPPIITKRRMSRTTGTIIVRALAFGDGEVVPAAGVGIVIWSFGGAMSSFGRVIESSGEAEVGVFSALGRII